LGSGVLRQTPIRLVDPVTLDEQAGVLIEGPVELRSSWALPVKLNVAFEIIAMLFWALLFVGALLCLLIASLVNGCAG
jgi:hypothetical protein